MPQMKVSNFFTDAANALSGLRRGKVEEETRQKEETTKDRLMQLKENENSRQEQELKLQMDSAQRQQGQFDILQKKEQEEEAAKPGLMQAIQHLDNQAQGLDTMTHDDLRALLQQLQSRKTAIDATREAHRFQLNDQLRLLRAQYSTASGNLANIKRARDDAMKRVYSDPALGQEFAALIRAKDPEPMRKMIQKITGQDLDSMHIQAGLEAQRVKNSILAFSGVAGVGPTVQTAPEVDRNMPFQLLPPDAQAKISQELGKRMAAGQPFDLLEARSRGIPVEQIAASVGKSIDPISGVTAPSIANPAPAKPSAPATGGPMSFPNVFGSAPEMNLGPSTAAASALDRLKGIITTGGAGTPGTIQQPTPPESGAGFSPRAMSPSPTGAEEQVKAAFSPSPEQQPTAGARGLFTPKIAPEAFPLQDSTPSKPLFTPGPAGNAFNAFGNQAAHLFDKPRGGFEPFGISPSMGALDTTTDSRTLDIRQGQGMAQPNSQYAPMFNGLRAALSLPQAEQLARQLLDQGHEYNQVIDSIPQQFKSLISARLPKRLPTSGTQPY